MPAAAAPWIVLLVVFALVVALAIARFWFRSHRGEIRGWIGEQRTARLHLGRLDSETYRSFHDMYLKRPRSSETTQVDHITVSRFGVFVIETKNLSGWIFGSENQKTWTVTYPSGEKHRLQNPLHQNRLHVRAVAEYCGLDPAVVHSLVYLPGSGQPKNKAEMGRDVIYRHGLAERIREYQTVQLDEATVRRCVERLNKLAFADKRALRKAHVKALRNRH